VKFKAEGGEEVLGKGAAS